MGSAWIGREEVTLRPRISDEHYAESFDMDWDNKDNDLVKKASKCEDAAEAVQKAGDEQEKRIDEQTKTNRKQRHEIEAKIPAEKRLREKALRNGSIFQIAMDGLCIIDVHGKILKANRASSEMLGYSIAEIVGMSIRDFETVETPAEIQRHIQKVMDTGSDRFEMKHRRKDGEIVDLEMSVNFFIGEDASFFSCFFHDITARKQAERLLRKGEGDLKIRTKELEEVNSALRVLLKARDEDKRTLEEKVLLNVKQLVAPYVEKLKASNLRPEQRTCLSLLESNLNNIVSPFVHELSSKYVGLTPKEITIAHLVREGKTTKEMAELLNLSVRTIEFHRRNIRTKLGIQNGKTSLMSYLLSMEDH